jgi:hypothetical protein
MYLFATPKGMCQSFNPGHTTRSYDWDGKANATRKYRANVRHTLQVSEGVSLLGPLPRPGSPQGVGWHGPTVAVRKSYAFGTCQRSIPPLILMLSGTGLALYRGECRASAVSAR